MDTVIETEIGTLADLTVPADPACTLKNAGAVVLNDLKGALPQKPTQDQVKAVVLRLRHDLSPWTGAWLAELTDKAVTGEGTQIIARIHEARDKVNFDKLLEQASRLCLSAHRKMCSGSAHSIELSATISEGLTRSPIYGFAALYLCHLPSLQLCSWVIKNLKERKEGDLEFFRAHSACHERFSEMLLDAFAVEAGRVSETLLKKEVVTAMNDATSLAMHIFAGE